MNRVDRWVKIALMNLTIVALLGFVLRSKLLFPMPAVNFKYTLHAHSHLAFSGWVTLALLALLVYELLPARFGSLPRYRRLLGGVLISALGMLGGFLYQGYGAVSITFSTLLIFTTYAFSYFFIRDVRRAQLATPVRRLAVWAMACLVLSSAGPFTLAYLMASKSPNAFLYKDAIYTYLHLQYSGFFTLGVFALLLNRLGAAGRPVRMFATLLTATVIPSMFASYLWHYPGTVVGLIAAAGSTGLLLCLAWFFVMMGQLRLPFSELAPSVRRLGGVAMAAFVLKTLFQALTVIPWLGAQVFANRPIIIGFLHLVLLGFVSLYLLAHFMHAGLLHAGTRTSFAVWLFAGGVIFNEAVLMGQGLGLMLMASSTVVLWLLWIAAICLLSAAVLIVRAALKDGARDMPHAPVISVLSAPCSGSAV